MVPVLASLFILPLGIYFFRLGVPISGLLGGLIGTFAGGYYMRSSIGRIDTDSLNLFFPALIALMILLEEGKIRLNDPVSLYIPEFAKTKVLVVKEDGTTELIDQTKEMTIRDLATHTSGIAYDFTANDQLAEIYRENQLSPYFTFGGDEVTPENLAKGIISSNKPFSSICDFAENLASKAPLMHQPSENYTYSMGMDVLGCVIERASAQTFDNFLNDKIFTPLGMKDTFFSVPNSKRERFTSLYAELKDLREYEA